MNPIETLSEIRAVRHQISALYHHQSRALLDHYRELETQYPHRMFRRRNVVAKVGEKI